MGPGVSVLLDRLHLKPLAGNVVSLLGRLERPVGSAASPWDELERIHPDKGGSSIIRNKVEVNPEYDIQVIIPVYKTAHTLSLAIDSVLNQELVGNVRVLVTVINDGSPDNSDEILRKYDDVGSVEVITQENRGFSGARNRGLQHLRGRYVTFLDSDDYLPPDALQRLLDKAASTEADIVQGGYVSFTPEGKYNPPRRPSPTPGADSMLGYPWGKLFRSRLFEGVGFPEGYWFEDTVLSVMIFPLLKPEKMVTINEPVYFYRLNPRGITLTAGQHLKVIDTLWVTRRLYLDREEAGIPLRADEYDMFLKQTLMNMKRVKRYGSKVINRLCFRAMADMKKRFFPDCTPTDSRLQPIHYALTKGKAATALMLARL